MLTRFVTAMFILCVTLISAQALQIDLASLPGADPKGLNDSCSTFQTAIRMMPKDGGAIHISGTFVSSCSLNFRDRSISIAGDGPGVSRIVFTNAERGRAGIEIIESGTNAGVTIEGLSIYTRVDQHEGNVAILVRYEAPSSIQKGPRFYNLDIRGEHDSYYWARGIDCYRCIAGSIDDIVISGKNTLTVSGSLISAYNASDASSRDPLTSNMDRAVSLDLGSNDFKIRGLHAYLMNAGLFVDNGSEGIGMDQSAIIAANWGVYNGPGQVSSPSQFVTESHFNTIIGGIYAPGCLERQYGPGNLFYKWTGSVHHWIGIDAADAMKGEKLIGCTQTLISGNIFYGFHGRPGIGGSSTGVRLGHFADWNDIKNNNSTLIDTFINMSFGRGLHNHVEGNAYQLVGEPVHP